MKIDNIIRKAINETLNESPNWVKVGKKEINYHYGFAFGYYDGEFYIGPFGKTHGDLADQISSTHDVGTLDRDDFEYAGRFWPDFKIISFWFYPENKSKLDKIIKDINDKTGFKITDKWKIEVIDNGQLDIKRDYEFEDIGSHYILVKDYTGSEKVSDIELKRKHEKSPITKNDGADAYEYHKNFIKDKDIEFKRTKLPELEEDILDEDPDFSDALGVEWEAPDAFTFGYDLNGNFQYSPTLNRGMSGTHQGMKISRYSPCAGRLWEERECMSFWTNPKTKDEMEIFIQDLSEASGISMDSFLTWKIEEEGGELYTLEYFMESLPDNIDKETDLKSEPDENDKRGQQHVISPINKQDIGKKAAEYHKGFTDPGLYRNRDMAFGFGENKNIVNESPDSIYYAGKPLTFTDNDAYTFGYYKNEFLIETQKTLYKKYKDLIKSVDVVMGTDNAELIRNINDTFFTHYALVSYKIFERDFELYIHWFKSSKDENKREKLKKKFNADVKDMTNYKFPIPNGRMSLEYPGRLWADARIISFWGGVKAKDLNKIIKDIYSKSGIKLGTEIGNDWHVDNGHELIPLKNIVKVDKQKDFDKQHAKSPIIKDKSSDAYEYHQGFIDDKNIEFLRTKMPELEETINEAGNIIKNIIRKSLNV